MTIPPKISVIVVCEPIDDTHKLVLPDFKAQTLPLADYEVLFVDGTGDGRHVEIIESMAKREGAGASFRHLPVSSLSRSYARNRGLEAAAAPLVLLLAEDFQIRAETLEAHVRFHERHPEPHIVGVGAAFFPPDLASDPFMRWLDETGTLFGVSFCPGSIPPHFFYGANTSLKTHFLRSVGPSHEAFPFHAWDDYELGLRLQDAGMRSLLVPGAEVDHVHHVNLRGRCKQVGEGGASAVVFERIQPARPRSWGALVDTPLAWLAWKVWLAWLGKTLLPHVKTHDRYYRARLDQAFVRAYRAAKSGPATVNGVGLP
ncbi:MAG: glycosyltransferase [Candidatus Methylacidiphilales bacterium]|nr:glycosyltransferase [Candidatus Methylacidiphilales bacterium]